MPDAPLPLFSSPPSNVHAWQLAVCRTHHICLPAPRSLLAGALVCLTHALNSTNIVSVIRLYSQAFAVAKAPIGCGVQAWHSGGQRPLLRLLQAGAAAPAAPGCAALPASVQALQVAHWVLGIHQLAAAVSLPVGVGFQESPHRCQGPGVRSSNARQLGVLNHAVRAARWRWGNVQGQAALCCRWRQLNQAVRQACREKVVLAAVCEWRQSSPGSPCAGVAVPHFTVTKRAQYSCSSFSTLLAEWSLSSSTNTVAAPCATCSIACSTASSVEKPCGRITGEAVHSKCGEPHCKKFCKLAG